jgi:hypothetical protein
MLDTHKRFILAIADGKYERVDHVIRAALANHAGIHGIINLYHRAAKQEYRPKGYTEEDDM